MNTLKRIVIISFSCVFTACLLLLCGCSCSSSDNTRESNTTPKPAKVIKEMSASYEGFHTNLVVAGEAPVKEDFRVTLYYEGDDYKSEEVTDFTIEPSKFKPIGNGETAEYTIRYKDYEDTVTIKGVTVSSLTAKYENSGFLMVAAELSNGDKVSVDDDYYTISEPVVNGESETVTITFAGKTTKATKTKSSTSTSESATTGAPKNVTDTSLQGTLVANAQAAVKKNLKSPSSAKFPWSFKDYSFKDYGTSKDHPGFTRYLISGYVDSQNSYGAEIRTSWSVEMDYSKAKDTYYVINALFNQ